MEARINKALQRNDFSLAQVPADKLASEIVNNYYRINIIDVRNPEAFKNYHLPFAINIPIEKIEERQWNKILVQKHKTNYFYSDDSQLARRAYLLAGYRGKAENFILTESADAFRRMFSDLVYPGIEAGKDELNIYNFRKKAANDMSSLVEALKNSSQPVITKTTKIKGGC
jgi:rhodanese-related sulfurtransferase